MYQSESQIRIHYALTDKMGVVYHGHYAQFYEIGRTDAIRKLGMSYKDIEATGVIMPVVELNCRFFQPAKYDDLITVVTTLKELPTGHKIVFHGEIKNEKGDLLSTASITMYFMQAHDMSKSKMPDLLYNTLEPFYRLIP